jgi:hypothetical protein
LNSHCICPQKEVIGGGINYPYIPLSTTC